MKCISEYKNKEKARVYRNRCRKTNYYGDNTPTRNSHKVYNIKECKLVLKHEITDRELAKMLERSIPAIQRLRNRLRKNKLTFSLQ